jgi:hypothetical protein
MVLAVALAAWVGEQTFVHEQSQQTRLVVSEEERFLRWYRR